jgi:hypothetical protein
MADLIDKFFQEDLTEAEEKAVSEELLSSEETALRLGEKAERAYLHAGLPEPIWPASNKIIPHLSKTIPLTWVCFWMILAGMAGIAAWWCFSQKHALPEPSASLKPSASVEMPRIISRDELSKAASPAHPEGVKRPSTSLSVPTGTTGKPQKAPAAVSAFPPPLNLDEAQGQSYTNLSVVVRRSTPGFLTVRVLNAQGSEVVLLYRGELAEGNWVFEWNGKLVDGRIAGPGVYQIEVQSGPFNQRKAIQIR